MMKTCLSVFGLLLAGSIAADVRADEPIYSLDQMTQHPYRYLPVYGHASQNPGSPRYFVPGYGYSIPGFGLLSRHSTAKSNDDSYYQFGQRTHGLYNDTTHRFWHNSYGGPWYYPGATTNTQDRWPGM